jgi:uncharacterized protein (TIGR02147 family)
MENSELNVYKYLDYRIFLADYYKEAKKKQPRFSYRVFSRHAGIKSPNFLQWLIDNKRNLSKSSIPRVCQAIKLNLDESEYFKNLVLFNQSKSIKEKSRYFDELKILRKNVNVKLLTDVQFEHYSNWHNKAIRELLQYYPFNPVEKYAFRRLAKQLAPAITESDARQAVSSLKKLGLVKRDADGNLRPADAYITTGDEVESFLVRKFNSTMIQKADKAIDQFPREVRDISSLTMSISDECFGLMKKEIQLFRKRLAELVQMDEKPNNVYQLNFQFFPLAAGKENQVKKSSSA